MIGIWSHPKGQLKNWFPISLQELLKLWIPFPQYRQSSSIVMINLGCRYRYIKQLIIARQQAFSCGNIDLWRHCKGKVKHAIQLKKKNFYSDKVRNLKKSDCRSWWKLINQLSGRSNSITPIHLEENGVLLTNDNLVTTLNHFFLSVNEDVPTLDLSKLPAYLPAADQLPIIHPYQVCKKLLCLNSSKAAGPDNIPPRILKDFAYELSDPIFNLSLASATSPSQ